MKNVCPKRSKSFKSSTDVVANNVSTDEVEPEDALGGDSVESEDGASVIGR